VTYNFFVVGDLHPDEIAAALSEILHVPLSDIEVADADADPDTRNWDALVTCEYSPAKGDMTWILDIYAQDSVANQPPERDLVMTLSARTQNIMLYRSEEELPSAYWLTKPDGFVTRARVEESDDHAFTVDAIETHIAQLPNARVERIPEVIREWRVALPVADQFKSSVDSLRESAPETYSPALSDEIGSPLWHAWNGLGAWEKLILRMEAAWLPYGWYPADFYWENLERRDQLPNYGSQLPEAAAAYFTEALGILDKKFTNLTVDDGGEALSEALGKPIGTLSNAWWWRRRPDPTPWALA
jgi:hypothetical protein